MSNVIAREAPRTMVDVKLSDGTTIEATDGHPFYEARTRSWVKAKALKVGAALVTATGALVAVTGTTAHADVIQPYNLTVEGAHTYYAGDTPVLVHNCGGPAGAGTGTEVATRSVDSLLGNAGDVVVLGRLPDTAVARDWAGHVVLNAPDWTLQLNDDFIAAAIQQGRSFYLASPLRGNLIQSAGERAGQPTVYARELGQLARAGYRKVGNTMVPGS